MKFFKKCFQKLKTALVMLEVVENADLNLVFIGIGICWLLHKGVQHILDYRFKCKQLESKERIEIIKLEQEAEINIRKLELDAETQQFKRQKPKKSKKKKRK